MFHFDGTVMMMKYFMGCIRNTKYDFDEKLPRPDLFCADICGHQRTILQENVMSAPTIKVITPGARLTNDISIEFEIGPKFGVPWFEIYYTDHNEILYTLRQCNCRDVCKIFLWSVDHITN